MKRQAGYGAAGLVALAAMFGVNSRQGSKSPTEPKIQSNPTARDRTIQGSRDALADGPCVELEGSLRAFFLVTSKETAAPDSCYADPDRTHGASPKIVDYANRLQMAIAIVPDPLHTHFSLTFDRAMEAIQQGAQDDHYYYDSSWLPWYTDEQQWTHLADADRDDDKKRAREKQPGILLFRNANPKAEPYTQGLVVFVVGEEPTSGIHKEQFQNAVAWIAKLQNRPPMKILGPTFSGSLPSLAQLLASIPPAESWIYSGTITSDEQAESFGETKIPGYQLKFRSFQESDKVVIGRYRSYLKTLGVSLSHLAIISEDETAFGTLGDVANDPLCYEESDFGRPACLYYPRDISALRDAYQKQSIFNAGSSGQNSTTGRRTLSNDIADPEGKQHDTIRTYGGSQTPLSQEAIMQQIVNHLRDHDSAYVILRASNPMDQLFLSHFLRLAYPQGRIVVQGADLLMQRESGAASLSGTMTLTTYPLFTWETTGHT